MKAKTGILVTGGLLALSIALTGCGGSAPDGTATPTAVSSEGATPIPQMILGMDPASVPVEESVKEAFGERANTLGTFALTFAQASSDVPAFHDPARVPSPEDAKLLIPFKDKFTTEAYTNLTTQLASGDLKLIPNTNTEAAATDLTVDGKKYTQQGKEFGFTYGPITFDVTQGAEKKGVMLKQEVKITVPTNEGNVVTHTDQRQIILEPGSESTDWKIATWRVERVTEAS